MKEGQRIKDFINTEYNNTLKGYAETFPDNSWGRYQFLYKVADMEELTPRARKRLLEDFGIDVNQVLNSNNIIDSNVADNGSIITNGDTSHKIENEFLKQKIKDLEDQVKFLKGLVNKLTSE